MELKLETASLLKELFQSQEFRLFAAFWDEYRDELVDKLISLDPKEPTFQQEILHIKGKVDGMDMLMKVYRDVDNVVKRSNEAKLSRSEQ